MKLQTDNFINDLERWARAYKNQIRALSYSLNTIELYSRAIDQFIEYSLQHQDEITMRDVKAIYITSFLSYLEDEARLKGKKIKNGLYLSKSTKITYLKAIKGFFTFISDNNNDLYTYDRYFKNIKVADSSKSEEKIIYLTEEEIGRLLNVLERENSKKGTYGTYRNSLLIKLMLYAGLRISEALQLKIDNFKEGEDAKIYKIDIYGKGGKNQIAFIFKSHIEEELEYFRNILENSDLIMKTKNGTMWNRSNAFEVVNNLYIKAQIYNKKGLHLLRHTLAMRLTQRDVNPVIIMKILRHSNIATTTIYAKATEESINKVII